MTEPAVSVVVVSRDRAGPLRLCLLGLSQLYYPNFEIIVVANDSSLPAIDAAGMAGQVKAVPFQEANISAARNAGIAASGGEIVAFIDDDAVPEPTWLDHLIAPFEDAQVAAAGGYVIGRNGISFQWKARMAFRDGRSVEIPIDSMAPHIFDGEPGRAIRTEGTNMAVRRRVLTDLGGFDEAFRFYLDETDLNMRLAEAGLATAVVPLAQVHHSFGASDRRAANRAPRSLFDIGRSLAIFHRKHGADRPAAEHMHRDHQRRRLLRLMAAGHLVPEDVRRLMKTFEAGLTEGASADFGTQTMSDTAPEFHVYVTPFSESDMCVERGRLWQRSSKIQAASRQLTKGNRVSLYLFSFSTLYHRLHFVAPGIWLQTGGQFGRSDRAQKLIQLFTSGGRVKMEVDRVRPVRMKRGHKNKD